MTAKRAGELAAEGFWTSLKRLRDQWVLLVFLATALFWTRDIYEKFVDLPQRVTDLHGIIAETRNDLVRLQTGRRVSNTDRSAALVFPGAGHSIEDGQAGDFVTVRLAPAKQLRPTCRAKALSVFMVDATGRWFWVATDLGHMPHFAGAQELAFMARVHHRMVPGRAELLMQVTQDCGTHLQIDSAPRLHFRVLPAAHVSQSN